MTTEISFPAQVRPIRSTGAVGTAREARNAQDFEAVARMMTANADAPVGALPWFVGANGTVYVVTDLATRAEALAVAVQVEALDAASAAFFASI